ncbi:hypothetical protein PUN28_002444 [Cardiocondyla obscurior]|uniref:Alpha 1,4-glycosyltransferase domain-containing protein n=2 Tax=Cardiocondyla obscurior TaxID=286306 RepID=A0AAW2GUE9_9HYME
MKKQRAFFMFCSLFTLIIIIVCVFWKKLPMILITYNSADHVYCYWSKSNGIMELGQGEWDKQMLVPSRCIFFHKTMCSLPNLMPLQACAVESAARNNRNLNVFLLFLATGHFSDKSKKLVNILETYNNVYVRRVRLSTYITNTPIEDWFWANIRILWQNRDWLKKDFHDYIRMLTLWKFGGLSLNLNSIVLTSLDELTTFTGVENNRDMGIGVFGVDASTNFGRSFVDICLDIIKNINVNNYSQYNITRVVTQTLQRLCYQKDNKECRQFTIYPPDKFYPTSLDFPSISSSEVMTEGMPRIGKDVMTIHLWNNSQDNAMVYKIAAKHCPKIYKFVGKNFLSM